MEDAESAIATLNALRGLDVKIDIDDFGTGYSSLSCIQEFPIDVLKIDRAFIANVSDARNLEALLKAVLTLADHLELQVVAEGIEESHQLTILQELGCRYGQGFLFARPMTAQAFGRLLVSKHSLLPTKTREDGPEDASHEVRHADLQT